MDVNFNNPRVGPLILFLVLLLDTDVRSEMVSMKIVDEPSSYGMSNHYGGLYQSPEDRLTMRVQPANFSGPPHLRRLVGRCFTMIDDNYKYEFCPFYNVTQHEQSLRWNPYSGVLGVYQEWEIENNTFVAMVMREGDSCNDIYRSVKVFFKCGNHSHINKVFEPHTCQYHMDFLSPLVCHKHAMVVYPLLNTDLQQDWNHVEGELVREEITKQGYNKKLRKIFEQAGFVLSSNKKELLVKEAEKKKEKETKTEETGEFQSLSKCTEEVTNLREEIKQLRAALLAQTMKNAGDENNDVYSEDAHQDTQDGDKNKTDPQERQSHNTTAKHENPQMSEQHEKMNIQNETITERSNAEKSKQTRKDSKGTENKAKVPVHDTSS